jgi:hypothetical protein
MSFVQNFDSSPMSAILNAIVHEGPAKCVAGVCKVACGAAELTSGAFSLVKDVGLGSFASGSTDGVAPEEGVKLGRSASIHNNPCVEDPYRNLDHGIHNIAQQMKVSGITI